MEKFLPKMSQTPTCLLAGNWDFNSGTFNLASVTSPKSGVLYICGTRETVECLFARTSDWGAVVTSVVNSDD